MPAWLLALLQILPSIITAIVNGLHGSTPVAASQAETEAHVALTKKYEAIAAILKQGT